MIIGDATGMEKSKLPVRHTGDFHKDPPFGGQHSEACADGAYVSAVDGISTVNRDFLLG
jgi:hypothetical protein